MRVREVSSGPKASFFTEDKEQTKVCIKLVQRWIVQGTKKCLLKEHGNLAMASRSEFKGWKINFLWDSDLFSEVVLDLSVIRRETHFDLHHDPTWWKCRKSMMQTLRNFVQVDTLDAVKWIEWIDPFSEKLLLWHVLKVQRSAIKVQTERQVACQNKNLVMKMSCYPWILPWCTLKEYIQLNRHSCN